jgi:hypothetical protein
MTDLCSCASICAHWWHYAAPAFVLGLFVSWGIRKMFDNFLEGK